MEKNVGEGEQKITQVLQKRFRTIDGQNVFLKTDMTRGTSNLLQYLTTRTENAPLLGPCCNL